MNNDESAPWWVIILVCIGVLWAFYSMLSQHAGIFA